MVKIGRSMILTVLLILCVTASLVMVMPIRSATNPSYDPWIDYNDDGKINLLELVTLANHYGATGDPVNKTALLIYVNDTFTSLVSRMDNLNSSLLELQSEINGMNATSLLPLIDSLNSSLIQLQSGVNALNTTVIQLQTSNGNLNASLSQLQSKVDTLNNTLSLQINTLQGQVAILTTTITAMNTTIAQLQNSNADLNSRVSALEGNLSSLLSRVSHLEGNNSVTNLMLAPYAIPFNSTTTYYTAATTETVNFVDMAYTSVTLTLNRTSQLLIFFSTDAYDYDTGNAGYYIVIRATVNSSLTDPFYAVLTPYLTNGLGWPYTHTHSIAYYMAYSFNFIKASVSPGTYTIQIQWYVTGGTGYAGCRSLTVIDLPSS